MMESVSTSTSGAKARLFAALLVCLATVFGALAGSRASVASEPGTPAANGAGSSALERGKKDRRWHYQRARTPRGTKPKAILEGSDKKGAASIVDLAVRPTKERYRTSKGGHRRVWQVRGTLAADFGRGDDHHLQKVVCSETTRGSKAATSPKNNVRLMYPRRVNRLKRVYKYSQPAFSAKGFGITLPSVQSVFFEGDAQRRPSVDWKQLRPNRHQWKWNMDRDGEPRSAEMRFIGHWTGPAKKLRFRIKCKVRGIDRQRFQPDDHSGVTFSIHRTVHAR